MLPPPRLGLSGLGAGDDDDEVHALRSPVTNGALLCDVVLALSPRLEATHPDAAILKRAASGRRPSSVRSAKARVRACLRTLAYTSSVPADLLRSASPYVLGGQRVWTLICRLSSGQTEPRALRFGAACDARATHAVLSVSYTHLTLPTKRIV